jgi:peptidyl-tRNA hydrolase, PTH1 family
METPMQSAIPPEIPEPLWEGPFLVAGLGNPGREYRHNRHNVGFMAVEHLSEKFKIPFGKVQSKAITGTGLVHDQKVLLVKPQTYMNLSGLAIGALAKYYKIAPDHMIIIHDDVDLPLGTLRLRAQGGAGGQKGMTSIIERLGTKEFPRLRLGVGRPPGHMQTADYVLEDFFPDEKEILAHVFDRVTLAVETFIIEGIRAAMTNFNGSVNSE